MFLPRHTRWALAPRVGAALAGPPAASGSVDLVRADIPVTHAGSPEAPESVALGDLDGQNGKDIVVALPAQNSVGVMLNAGDGTFGAMTEYPTGCTTQGVVDITLGDVTTQATGGLSPDGKLDAYVACTPYVIRLRGDGAGHLTNPESFNLGVQSYTGPQTADMLALIRRPDGNTTPLLVFQHAQGSFDRRLCASYELDPSLLVCDTNSDQGPLVVAEITGSQPGVPPDEIVTSEGGDKMGVLGFVKVPG